MALDFILGVDAQTILEEMKRKYREDNGEDMEIGSDAFAISSVVSYIMSVLTQKYNERARQRYIDTATGEYLTGIGETLGVPRPTGKHGTVLASIKGTTTSVIPAGYLSCTFNGVPYTLYKETAIDNHPTPAIFIGTGDDYEAENDIGIMVEGENISGQFASVVERITTNQYSGGATLPSIEGENDDEYRKYIKDNMLWKTYGGSASAYEAKTRIADSRVTSAYCVPFTDPEWEGGKAIVYYQVPETIYYLCGDVEQRIKDALTAEDWKPVCDTVELHKAVPRQIHYILKVRVTEANFIEIQRRTQEACSQYRDELFEHLGQDFCPSELCKRLLTPDENGVCAVNVRCSAEFESVAPNEVVDATMEDADYEVV